MRFIKFPSVKSYDTQIRFRQHVITAGLSEVSESLKNSTFSNGSPPINGTYFLLIVELFFVSGKKSIKCPQKPSHVLPFSRSLVRMHNPHTNLIYI